MNPVYSFTVLLVFVTGIQAWDLTYECATATFIKAEEYSSSLYGKSSLVPSSLPTLPSVSSIPSSFSGYFNASSTELVISSSSGSGALTTTSSSSSSSSSGSTSTTSSATSTSALSTFASEILDEHNKKRALHGSPPLTWNSDLTAYAQNYVDNGYDACAGSLEHSNVYYGKASGYGENLAIGYTYTGAVDAWYSEISNYNYANPSASTGTTGHFTQVVWNTTTELGCAYKYCGAVWSNYIVCEYYPPGNVAGEYSQHVPPLLD